MKVGSAEAIRHLGMGVPQGSPLSPILFLVYIQDLLDRLNAVDGASAQAFADDVITWWVLSKGQLGESISDEIGHILVDWAHKWKMTFSSTKCKILVVGRIRSPPPVVLLGNVALKVVPVLRYLGVWIDSGLTWRTHIRLVAQKALGRLRAICRGIGTFWGLHPIITRHMIDAVVIPTLFYAAPIWSTAVCRASCLAPLDRVLRLCAISTLGLYRTVSLEAAQAIAGFLPAEFQIRQHLIYFYLQQLVAHCDLLSQTPSTLGVNSTAAPIDILWLELRQLQKSHRKLLIAASKLLKNCHHLLTTWEAEARRTRGDRTTSPFRLSSASRNGSIDASRSSPEAQMERYFW